MTASDPDAQPSSPNTQHPESSTWRTFDVLPGETAAYEVARVLARAQTAFQDVEIAETLRLVFPIVRRYRAEVPFFKDSWAFLTASAVRDPAALPPGYVDRALSGRGVGGLRFYDGITHVSMFSLPKYARS